MRIMKKILCMFMTLVVLGGAFQMDARAASVNTKFYFIDVATDVDAGKGDATLIDCNGTYVLVDCGTSSSYEKLYSGLISYCTKTNGKVVIEALIITHNHVDHMGAIQKLFDASDITVKQVYYTGIGPIENIRTIRNAVPIDNRETIHIGATKTLTFSGTTIKLYGPAKDFTNGDTSTPTSADTNNSSMMVQVKGSISGLIMGDLELEGLKAAKSTYGSTGVLKSGNNYDVCKFGHHGLRRSSESDIITECNLYKDLINAEYYVMTASTAKIRSEDILATNYALIKKQFVDESWVARGNCYIDDNGIEADILF